MSEDLNTCRDCGQPLTQMAWLEDGNGWWLYWGHPQGPERYLGGGAEPCSWGPSIDWPIDVDQAVDAEKLIELGFTIEE